MNWSLDNRFSYVVKAYERHWGQAGLRGLREPDELATPTALRLLSDGACELTHLMSVLELASAHSEHARSVRDFVKAIMPVTSRRSLASGAQSSVAPDGSSSVAPPGAPSSAPPVNAGIGPAPESDDGDDKKGQ